MFTPVSHRADIDRTPSFRHAIVAALVTLALAGCATLAPSAERIGLDQVVARSKAGESADSLVAALRTQGTAYGLSGSDFARLRANGVPDLVLDELQRLEIAAAEDRERLRRWEPPWPYRPWWFGPHYVVVKPRPKPP